MEFFTLGSLRFLPRQWAGCALIVVLALCAGPLRAADTAAGNVAGLAQLTDEDLPITADTLPLLRGRWYGLWTQADGSRGHLKLQMPQAGAERVVGVLSYYDTAYRDNEGMEFDHLPELRDGALLLNAGSQSSIELRLARSGSGYRLRWTDCSRHTRLCSVNEASKGAVRSPPPPALERVIAAVPVSNTASSLPRDWQKSGAFMQIYVRAFKDSNGDGIGDLKGLTASLDYLRDLGIKGIWLMPILVSQDHDHGYATSDYRAIEPAYGTTADLVELLAAAHKRGIGVIMDYVMNHSAVLNPVFANAASAPDNPYRDWYVWADEKSDDWNIYGRNPWHRVGKAWYFAGFSGSMPDWNLKNRAVVEHHFDNLRYWLNLGVDGFRFDAVGNLVENGADRWESQPQSYALMREVRALLDRYQHRYLVCEGPADPAGFAEACGSSFAFGHNRNVIKAARGNAGAIQSVADYAHTTPSTMATMLSNHDAFAGRRLYDQTRGDLAVYALAAATYLTQPGIPFIYYGEEIGMAGGKGLGGDAELRTPMSWTADVPGAGFSSGQPFRALSANAGQFNVAAQRSDSDSLYSVYRDLLQLRKNTPALASGSYQQVMVNDKTLSFQRLSGSSRVVVFFNYGREAAELGSAELPSRLLKRLYGKGAAQLKADAQGKVRLVLPAQSFAIYRY